MLKLILLSLTLVTLANGNTFTNPVSPKSPDPWMVYHNGYFYLTATTFGNWVGIKKSKTLEGLKTAPNTRVYTANGDQVWAPEIHEWNGKWYLFYTACEPKSSASDCHRNHVAESVGADPMGPYQHKGDFAESHAELDPSFIKINGKLYLLASHYGQGQQIAIRELSNPWTAVGTSHIISSPTLAWEKQGWTVNEGPEPLYHGNKVFIVYSASLCSTPDYKLGLLEFTGTDPLNADHWKKHPNPILQRSDAHQVYGPGHNGFFKSPDGKEDWIVYHANDSPQGTCDGNRSARCQKVTWGADGLPVIGEPVAANTAIGEPSGE